MNRFASIVAGALVAVLVTSGAAFAQGQKGGGRGLGARALELRGLNLTDAQEQQVRDIRRQEREGTEALRATIRAAAAAQQAAIRQLPVNEGLIRETTAALSELQAEVAIRQAHLHSQVWAVLTPAQQARATQIRAEREARQKQRAGERGQERQQRRRG